tara:strand:- start:637 stop:2379 length:1743 start_codon:yes stop_codon:yes gene_type:complete
MISSSRLSKIIYITTFFAFLLAKPTSGITAEDIWKKNENKSNDPNEIVNENKATIESPILSKEIEKISITINEQEIDRFEQRVIGIFDPQINNLNLNMWSESDGDDVKKVLARINKMKLSKFSEDLLFQVLFTNSYPPKKNLSSKEFLKIKVDWLIKNKRLDDLETLLNLNPSVGENKKVVKLLVNEYLSSSDIKSACEKTGLLSKDIQSNYLDKFLIYCLINQERKEEAQLIFELLKDRGNKDKFFEEKINFLLGIKETTIAKINDDNLLNFFLSHITSNDFLYDPNEKTNKYIWRYLSSANLIKAKDFENEEIVLTYEKAASEESLKNDEIFEIYKQILFGVNQLINSKEVYKNLPNVKARALIYQSILLTDDAEKKIYLAFLLKDLFEKDNLASIYEKEFFKILSNIDERKIPESFKDIVTNVLEKNLLASRNVKFDNDILHRSKVIKHFLENKNKTSKTEKDFKSVYKKIKRNKKYFISIKDIVVLESLQFDGIAIPKDLDIKKLSAELTVPDGLEEMVEQQQIGLVMLKIVEIIGEDKIEDLDPETIYFLNNILNQLKLKKIRNHILSEVLPVRV